MKVSVIVPVYNSSNYLRSCLDSLVNQTLQEIEIIAIDDNSSDDSLSILKEYEKKFPGKIKVFHNDTNLGQSATRNRGIALATGEYIGFVDSDDYVNYNMYKTMYDGIAKNGYPEVAVTNILFVKNNYYLDEGFSFLKSREGVLHDVLDDPSFILDESPSACNKLFRKDIVQDGLFLEGRMWEDIAFSFAKMFDANRVLSFENADYFYRRRMDEGVSSKGYHINSHLLDIFDVADRIEEETKKKGRYDILRKQINIIQVATCLQRIVEVMSWPIAENDKDNICRMMSNLVVKKYGDWRKLPVEELSARVGFLELEKLRNLVSGEDTTMGDLEEELKTIHNK